VIRYMLDTNICIYVIKNLPLALRERFNAQAEQLCISSVTLSELIYGAEKSARPDRNLAIVEGFAARLAVLSFDEKAAQQSGQIRADLARKGTPIGPYDVMIAGHARGEGLCLVTHDEREFRRVEGLRIENWVTET
jgi:tRNA(fMet)-specific endonuclease VapC